MSSIIGRRTVHETPSGPIESLFPEICTFHAAIKSRLDPNLLLPSCDRDTIFSLIP
jgi:hypothetical protein